MKKITLSILIFITVCVKAQTVIYLDTIAKPVAGSKANVVKALASDSLSSSFCILIPNEVKAHKHVWHSEQVYVIQGKGVMRLGDKNISIKSGDLIFIPKNTIHAVTSMGEVPLKVLSVQSPLFDGSDRVMVSE